MAWDAFEPYLQRLEAAFEYPVHFTDGLFEPANPLLVRCAGRLGENRRHRVAVLVDDGLAAASAGLIGRIRDYFAAHGAHLEMAAAPRIVPGGPKAKAGMSAASETIGFLAGLRMDRHSYVLAVGGGSMLDMAGFAASVLHRGLRLLRAPTTTLAQDDGGVGVKTGLDDHGAKNLIGTFAPPFAVLNDFSFLASLEFAHWIGGVSEAFKVAMIRDGAFFDTLCGCAAALRNRDMSAMRRVVYRSAVLHLDHLRAGGDPFEQGSGRPLDFGHWAAHKLELLSGYRLPHGQAVAIGVALDSATAVELGLLDEKDFGRLCRAMRDCGLPLYDECMASRLPDGRMALLAGLDDFREHLGGELTITLPDGIGRSGDIHYMDAKIVASSIEKLAKLGHGQASFA